MSKLIFNAGMVLLAVLLIYQIGQTLFTSWVFWFLVLLVLCLYLNNKNHGLKRRR
jgi:hypothetical protein